MSEPQLTISELAIALLCELAQEWGLTPRVTFRPQGAKIRRRGTVVQVNWTGT